MPGDFEYTDKRLIFFKIEYLLISEPIYLLKSS